MGKTGLNIAMLGHKRIPSREGGIEVVVSELAPRMAALGHCVTCYNRSGHHTGGREFDSDRGLREWRGVTLRNAPAVDRRGLAAMTASVSGAVLAALGRYDVVHFHAEGPAFMCWLPRLTGKRVVVTVHGLDHRRAKWGRFARAYIMAGEKNAVRFADEIIVLSQAAARYFQKTYGRKTRIIPNGVTRPEVREAELIGELGLEKDSYLLYVGRLTPEKGLFCLIDAFRQLQTDKKLVIAGGASDTDDFVRELKDRAQPDGRVLFTGFVQGRLLEELYSNAYLYCLPSDLEGMPLTLMEAMSYGCCCVTSDIPECADVVEDRAVTFRCGSTEDLREKLQMLCGDGSLVEGYRRGAAGFICKKYSWDETVRLTLAVYRGPDPVEDSSHRASAQ